MLGCWFSGFWFWFWLVWAIGGGLVAGLLVKGVEEAVVTVTPLS